MNTRLSIPACLALILWSGFSFADDDGLAAALAVMSGSAAVEDLSAAGRVPAAEDCRKQDPANAYPSVGVVTENGQTEQMSVIPKEKLGEVMSVIRHIGLPWQNADVCRERAHIMGYELGRQMGVTVGKVMLYPSYGRSLTFDYGDGRKRTWKYHVAPVVNVQEPNGQIEKYVVDLSTSREPMRLEDWKAKFQGVGSSYITNRIAFDASDRNHPDLKSYIGKRAIDRVEYQMRNPNRKFEQ